MADVPPEEQAVDWKAIGAQLAAGGATELSAAGLAKAFAAANIETHGGVTALGLNITEDVAGRLGQLLHNLEEPFLPVIAAFVAPILAGLFGAEIGEGDLRQRLAPGAGNRGAASIVDGFMRAIVGDTPAEIEPSDAGAKRVAAAAVQASLESTFNALVPELLSDLLPFDLGHFKELTELPESIIRTLGVSRLVRGALRPIVTTCCTTPATWQMNKLHRPTMLGAATLAKQIARHPDQREAWLEDLRREGYSEARIEALLNDVAKFHSTADVDLLVRAQQWSESEALQHLRDQGYDPEVAHVEYQIEELKRINSFERSMADAAVDGYVAGRLDEGTAGGFWNGATLTARDKARYDELAAARRICARRPLSSSEAEAAVKAGILASIDYRRALERENRDDDAVLVLELLLRYQLDKEKSIEQHRKELEAERAAEKAARIADAAARKAAADARLALARRGNMNDLEAAYIRGLIPLDRVTEIYAATYDGETAGILSALLQTKRADYVAQLAAAEAARVRAATHGVNVGELETAVLTGVLDVGQFRRRLDDLHFAAGDADLLTATLQARIQARDETQRQHDDAAAAAKIRHVDLPTYELLVRRGHRSLDDYTALLTSMNFDAGAVAALRERLQIQIDDDAAAAQQRADAAAKLRAKGLSLDEFRRAVVLGFKSVADFSAFVLANGFTADAAAVLAAELQTDVDEAAAARARRATAERRVQADHVPLADVRRAARLGLIPVETYYARLTVDGYTDDDVSIESDLLAAEIADDAARKAAAAAREAAAAVKGLTLAQLAAAVKLGTAPIADYTARALAIGMSAPDADLLTRTLQAELDTVAAARARRDELGAQHAARELARADVAKGVIDELVTMDDYHTWLLNAGYADDDAALLVAELQFELDAKAAKAAPQG